jgi:hypothetical protein
MPNCFNLLVSKTPVSSLSMHCRQVVSELRQKLGREGKKNMQTCPCREGGLRDVVLLFGVVLSVWRSFIMVLDAKFFAFDAQVEKTNNPDGSVTEVTTIKKTLPDGSVETTTKVGR